MKAAVFYGMNDLRVEEVPIPEPGEEEILVRVIVCGICTGCAVLPQTGDAVAGAERTHSGR